MEKELSSEEIRERIKEIRKEQLELLPAIMKNDELENERKRLQNICKHENAYEHGRDKDDYEGRVYAKIICHDCGHMWEERIRLGNCPYPKWSKEK